MKKLIANLINGQIKRSPELDGTICPGETVKVFTVESDTLRCKIWNSSNSESFSRDAVCKSIATKLVEDEDEMGGSVSYNLNEIMFEIEEK